MKRTFDQSVEKLETNVVVISAGYISTDSSPEPEVVKDNKNSNAKEQTNSLTLESENLLGQSPTCSYANVRFPPVIYQHQIPSVRMGPPYPGVRHQMSYRPQFQPARKFPTIPVFRNRLFSPGLDVPSTLIATINLDDDVSSTSSATSTASEGDETDNGSTQSSSNSAKPSQAPVVKTEFRAEGKAIMSSGQARVLAPIVIDDSDDESPQTSPQAVVKKAKISVEKSAKKSVPSPTSDLSDLLNLLPCSDSEEDMTEFLQYGMGMINQEDLIKKILTAPLSEKPKRLNQKGLYSHVKHGLIGKVMAFLNVGTNPAAQVKGEEGRTALHIAASKGYLDMLLVLLYKAGTKRVDIRDNNNRTPLFYAVEKKHLSVAQFLVKAGADFRIKNTEGMNLLHAASRRGSIELVKWLVKIGISLNEQDKYGWTALMWAAENDVNHLLMRYLIKKGAYTNLLDNEMNICLHWSAISGSFECTRVLVSDSAIADVNTRNKFGETPLHVAAKGDHYHVTQFLLLHGANHKIKNKNNETALEVCPASSKTFHCIRIRDEVVDNDIKKSHYMYINDISHGKERIPISCINQLDDEPFLDDFIYITKPEESGHVSVKRGLSTVRPCKCTGACVDCKCIQLSEKQKLWYLDDGKIDVAIFDEESPVLYECTPLCSCWSYCPNRLVQKGIQHQLQVFKTRNKGWGLRSLVPIQQGAFILSYVGELITDEEAEGRNEDTYLFNLDLKTSGDEPNCMDALKYGNCGRFINHSCDANMRAVKLFTSHRDISFPEIAFFAFRDIEIKEELCFNYGDSFWDVKLEYGEYCKCHSDSCQYSR